MYKIEPKIKPMIENLRDEHLSLRKKNKEKVLNFVLRLGRSWRSKKAPKNFPEYLWFPSKIPNIKKISNKHLNLSEAEISLDEIIKFR